MAASSSATRPRSSWTRRRSGSRTEARLVGALELAVGERRHAQQRRAVAEARDLGLPIGAGPVADRQLDDAQVLLGGAEDQVEVAERIDLAEEASGPRDALVVLAEEDLRPAERVLEALLEDGGQREAEHLVADHVEEPHRLPFHRVDEPRAVDELAPALGDGRVELGQVLGRHGQIRVEEEEDAAGGRGEALAARVAP